MSKRLNLVTNFHGSTTLGSIKYVEVTWNLQYWVSQAEIGFGLVGFVLAQYFWAYKFFLLQDQRLTTCIEPNKKIHILFYGHFDTCGIVTLPMERFEPTNEDD